MILDERSEFCTATNALGTDASAIVGDVMDVGNFTKDLGTGEPLYSGGTSAEFQLRTSTAAALTGGTTVILASSAAIAVANLTAGTTLIYALPSSYGLYQRYLGIWKVTVGAVAAGAINSFLTKDASKWYTTADNGPGAV
jgi:hypothetical protein